MGVLISSCCQGNTDDFPNKCFEVEVDPRKIIGSTREKLPKKPRSFLFEEMEEMA